MRNTVGNFEIWKEMCQRNMDIRLAPLDNIRDIEFHDRKPSQGGPVTFVTIALDGDLWRRFKDNEFIGGLLISDATQYEEIHRELKSRNALAADSRFHAWMAGVEFGLKQHEKGRNLEFALDEARKVYTE